MTDVDTFMTDVVSAEILIADQPVSR